MRFCGSLFGLEESHWRLKETKKAVKEQRPKLPSLRWMTA